LWRRHPRGRRVLPAGGRRPLPIRHPRRVALGRRMDHVPLVGDDQRFGKHGNRRLWCPFHRHGVASSHSSNVGPARMAFGPGSNAPLS
jgi:hypothetical protein